MSKPLSQMSKQELKQYLSENRNDDDKSSAAMGALLEKIPPEPQRNPSFSSFEEADAFFQQHPLQE